MAPFIGNAIPWPEVMSGLSGPKRDSPPGQAGGPSQVPNSLSDYEQQDRAGAESGVPELTTLNSTVEVDKEDQDPTGEYEEEFTEAALLSSLPRSFLSTAVPPQMSGGMMLQSENISSTTAYTEEALRDPGSTVFPEHENLQASNQDLVPGGLVTTDKIPGKIGFCFVIPY